MMQKQFNIQKKFRYTVYVLLLVSLVALGVSGYVFILSAQMVDLSKQKIYVLDNGKSLLAALREDMSENREAEARDHIKRFHSLFFTLEPDKSYIENNVREALYLADRSAMEQYQSFKENNLYNQVIASDISMTLQVDSVKLDFSSYPYRFSFKGKQKIVRKSNITIRNLETEGYLRNISRTDNNPHGFLMESWRIVQNNDIKTIRRKSF